MAEPTDAQIEAALGRWAAVWADTQDTRQAMRAALIAYEAVRDGPPLPVAMHELLGEVNAALTPQGMIEVWERRWAARKKRKKELLPEASDRDPKGRQKLG